MNRPPYPARVAAGLLVTTVEEARRLPTRVITFPMSAVSSGLQAGMRLQQNIAELAIKGDDALSMFFDAPEEQPAWATFDEDEVPDAPAPVPNVSAKAPATKATATKTPTTKAPAAKTPAAKAPVAKPTDKPATDSTPAAQGRLALYSSVPADVAAGTSSNGAAKPASSGSVAEIVEELEYDTLTLAQLRAKVRGLGADDLQALADHERANRNRAPFVTMIDNRIASQQKKSDAGK
ncbi:lipid droplet-associated protein [Gordonia zhaorongruii]|uniref:lipid droplet-associated protein n=1 Tax=Gordonia zhaorongruii TaxID=2597659 RepID=UPI0010512F5D|nr:lipid droplet-associated protein [Gordonia zhaorongruii]